MTADRFSPGVQDPEDPKPIRAMAVTAFLMLVTAFLYQSMDGVQRANEQAERREHLARAACRAGVYDYAADPGEDNADIDAASGVQTVADPPPSADPAVP